MAELSVGQAASTDPQVAAAIDAIQEGELPDVEEFARRATVEGAANAAAGACAAVGLPEASPVCAEIGGAIGEWAFEKAWPVIENVWNDVTDEVGSWFGWGDDRAEEAAKHRAQQGARLNAARVGEWVLWDVDQQMILPAWFAAVRGLRAVAERLRVTELGPYGYDVIAFRLATVHALPVYTAATLGIPVWTGNPPIDVGSELYRWRDDSAMPAFRFPNGHEKIRALRRALNLSTRYCRRSDYTAAEWDADYSRILVASAPWERERLVLWTWCGSPYDEDDQAIKVAAAELLADDAVTWLAGLQRAVMGEAVLLARLAAGIETARELETRAEYDAAVTLQRDAELARWNARHAESQKEPAPSRAGWILAGIGGLVAAAGALWWYRRRAPRRRS